LIASQESERKRIAAELHDSLGQRLVVIKNLALMFLRDSAGASAKGDALGQIEEISAEASHALGEVKEISYNLRPYQLDRIGLTKALEALARTAAASSSVAFTADIDDIDRFFPQESEINFYRIVQEGVNNIVKHSQASRASVRIQRDAERLPGRGTPAKSLSKRGPRSRADPCQLAEPSGDLLLHHPAQGPDAQRLPRPEHPGRAPT
jgi:signal transduction histidine kinase